MKIDFERLKAERSIDPFSLPPIDIRESLALTAEVIRDSSLRNPEVLANMEFGISRVFVKAPTPRLRQRLAILGWVPFDPASDDVWFLDEPISFPSHANRFVVDFAARYYAEGMNLLFAPDDGMFDGGSAPFSPEAGALATERRAHVRLMAERCYVALSYAVRGCRPTLTHHALTNDIRSANAARARAELEPFVIPSFSTVRLWEQEFNRVHAKRPGLGSEWTSHERMNLRG